LQHSINGEEVTWPIGRFKTDAVSAYLMQPILQNFFNTAEILKYWELCNVSNRIFDILTPGVFAPKNKDEVMKTCLNHLSNIDTLAASTQSTLRQALQTLGPLVTI
jgi:hypothetical protein